jgi:uncharacterized protein
MHPSERETFVLAEVFTEVQARFADFTDLAHGWEHVYRVYHLALRIAEQEHADSFLVGLAALLHDLGRTIRDPTRPHAERSALLAAELLARYDLPYETQQRLTMRSSLIAIIAASLPRPLKPVCSTMRTG